jgi:predicted nuclease of predicted toxin-antitoxin system
LLDENSSSSRFRRALEKAGRDVEIVADVLGAGAPDAPVAAYAIRTARVLITRDQEDFHEHYRGSAEHPGLIVIYPGPSELDAAKLAIAVGNVEGIWPKPAGLILSLSEFYW